MTTSEKRVRHSKLEVRRASILNPINCKPLIDPKKTQENSRSELGFTVASVQQGLGEWGLGPLFASPKFCVNPVRIYVEVSGLGAPLKNSKALTLNYEGAKL